MEKVKVNKEVAIALQCWIEMKGKDLALEEGLDYIHRQCGFVSSHFKPLNELSVPDFCKCLTIGYELEQTPEEKLLEKFDWIKDEYKKAFDKGQDVYIHKYQGMYDGLKCAVETLGHKIKGINA